MKQNLYRFKWAPKGNLSYDFLFLASPEEVEEMQGKEVKFPKLNNNRGVINPEVAGKVKPEDITLISEDDHAVQFAIQHSALVFPKPELVPEKEEKVEEL